VAEEVTVRGLNQRLKAKAAAAAEITQGVMTKMTAVETDQAAA
jgi:hypothetical protein